VSASPILAPVPASTPAVIKTSARQPGVLILDPQALSRAVWWAAAVVVTLGVLREIALPFIGGNTMLKNLRHFAFDSEHSLPAWLETVQMAAASALLAVRAALSHRLDPENRTHWSLLAIVFFALCIDESVSFHEVTMAPLRQTFNLSGYLYFSWVLIAAPLVAAFGAYCIPFLLRLPPQVAVRFVIAGALFVGGAFGLEFVGGRLVSAGGFDQPAYKLVSTLEEILEITGMALFVTSLIQHLAACTPRLTIAFAPRT